MEQLKKEESIAFYKTVSQPCPYLEGQTEQKVFTRLETENNDFMHTLTPFVMPLHALIVMLVYR